MKTELQHHIIEERPLEVGERIKLRLDLIFRRLANDKQTMRLTAADREQMKQGLQTSWKQ